MAVITQLAKLTLDKRPDPQLDWKWWSPNIPLGLPSNYLESIDLPFNNIDVGETLYAGGRYFNYPGPHKIGNFGATFYEDQKGTALLWVQKWKALIKTKAGAYNLPSAYKQNWKITLLTTQNVPVLTAELVGCWPLATSNYSLNYTGNGRLIVSQEFAVDDVNITWGV